MHEYARLSQVVATITHKLRASQLGYAVMERANRNVYLQSYTQGSIQLG